MTSVFALIISFIALLWAANHLVSGASGIAYHYKRPPLIIGFILLGLGCCAPKIILVSRTALNGLTDLTIANALNFNLANIGLIIGLSALLKPFRVQTTLLRREYSLLYLAILFSYSLIIDGYLGILDGCLFILLCIAAIAYTVYRLRPRFPQKQLTFQQTIFRKSTLKAHIWNLILGLIVLPISAKYTAHNCIQIAHWLGMNEYHICLTIAAISSNLPELTVALIAAFKSADELAIGTILGANFFSLLVIMSVPSIIHPVTQNHMTLWRDIPILAIITLIIFAVSHHKKKKITSGQAWLLIAIYCGYMGSSLVDIFSS